MNQFKISSSTSSKTNRKLRQYSRGFMIAGLGYDIPIMPPQQQIQIASQMRSSLLENNFPKQGPQQLKPIKSKSPDTGNFRSMKQLYIQKDFKSPIQQKNSSCRPNIQTSLQKSTQQLPPISQNMTLNEQQQKKQNNNDFASIEKMFVGEKPTNLQKVQKQYQTQTHRQQQQQTINKISNSATKNSLHHQLPQLSESQIQSKTPPIQQVAQSQIIDKSVINSTNQQERRRSIKSSFQIDITEENTIQDKIIKKPLNYKDLLKEFTKVVTELEIITEGDIPRTMEKKLKLLFKTRNEVQRGKKTNDEEVKELMHLYIQDVKDLFDDEDFKELYKYYYQKLYKLTEMAHLDNREQKKNAADEIF